MYKRQNPFRMGLERFSHFQARFGDFSRLCTDSLNASEFYPGVVFEILDECSCRLRAFGQEFHISFEMAAHDDHFSTEIGVLEVSQAVRVGSQESRELLLRWFFDDFGNVRKSLEAKYDGRYPLHERGFIIEFTDELASAYLSKVALQYKSV